MGQKYNIILCSFLILSLFAAGSSIFLLPLQNAEASHISLNWKYRNWSNVEVKVTNSGSSTAKNVYVWVAWDKDEKNKVWTQKKYGPISVKPGWTQTVTMYLDKPPIGKWAKFKVAVWGDNINTVRDSADKWVKRGGSTSDKPVVKDWAYWDKVCKNKYGENYKYRSSDHKCVTTGGPAGGGPTSSSWKGKIGITDRITPQKYCNYDGTIFLKFYTKGDRITGDVSLTNWKLQRNQMAGCQSSLSSTYSSISGYVTDDRYGRFVVFYYTGGCEYKISGDAKNNRLSFGRLVQTDFSCTPDNIRGSFTANRW